MNAPGLWLSLQRVAQLLQDEVPPPSPCSPAAPTRCVSSAGRGSLPCCSAPPSRPAWHRTARLSWDPASYPVQTPPPPSLSPPSMPPPLACSPSFQLPNRRRRGEGPQGLGSSKVRAVAASSQLGSLSPRICSCVPLYSIHISIPRKQGELVRVTDVSRFREAFLHGYPW